MLALAAATLPAPASGQEPATPTARAPTEAAPTETDSGWNDPRVLQLVARARELRHSTSVDPEFRTYSAQARGYVYFFMDRPDSAEQVLVKADQVALDVWWRAPNDTRQTIVGQRDQKLLPTSIRYHLDHLTVIQDDFGDYIRLGNGDEVESVLHPVGPGSEQAYDFLLSDSLRISYAGGQEEVRVYEVHVRPKRFDRPGFVGSIYLDRDRAAIVRMAFSFTPSSYVDPYLDYIRISLDNSLWMGAYWLPYRQEIEIRREIPVFDFMAGSVIRGKFDIGHYDFNAEPPPRLFNGQRTIRSLSPAQRQAFPFERGLFDDLEETDGLRPSPSIEEVETQVREVVQDRVLSGLKPIRFHGGRLSDFARYDRAEGVYLGAGASFRPYADLTVRTTAGYAIGRDRGAASLTLSEEERGEGWSPALDAYWDALGDIGSHPGSTLLENSISSLSGSKDYLDPYFRRGATLRLSHGGDHHISLGLRVERQVGALDVVSDSPDTKFRPVRSIEEGTAGSLEVHGSFGLPGNGQLGLTVGGGRLGDRNFGSLAGDARWRIGDDVALWSAALSVEGAVTNPGAPPQNAYLLGGRATLLGHDYRLFAGNAYWLARVEGTVPVRAPWVGIHGFVGVGSTVLRGMTLPADWNARDSRGLRGTAGLGLAIGWNTIYFDVGRALWGRGWEAMLSVAPEFRSWL